MQNDTLIFVLVLAAFIIGFLLIDWYVFQSIKTITANWKGPSQQIVRWGYWILFSGLYIALIFSLISFGNNRGFTPLSQWTFNLLITFFVTKLVIIFFLFAEDIYRLAATAINYIGNDRSTATANDSFMPDRRAFISQAGVLLAGIPFLSFIYGMTIGKHKYTIHRHVLHFPNLPENFDGFTITQISDIHSGSFRDSAAVQEGIDLIMKQKSDMFVFTGDLVNNVSREILPWMKRFSQIKAPFGQYSILGNHDYAEYARWKNDREKAEDFQKLKGYHKELGYRLLLNENVEIEKDGQKITLAGVENWGIGFPKKGDLNKALNGVDPDNFKILLSHDPSHWDHEVKQHPANVELTLSGHTHGMQFGIEVPGFKWSPAKLRYPNWAGLAGENNRYLYVNRGFGFNGFSGRVGIWPEITVLELRRG